MRTAKDLPHDLPDTLVPPADRKTWPYCPTCSGVGKLKIETDDTEIEIDPCQRCGGIGCIPPRTSSEPETA